MGLADRDYMQGKEPKARYENKYKPPFWKRLFFKIWLLFHPKYW